ncbi:hypothetical protein CIY_19180 [Butyrivibrio fibrisolvens 16/4]|nr:hypothetical protein CIY_19180 [Butyrivibrio fibrisolvens 16/4]
MKKRFAKLISLALVGVMSAGVLAGCGNSNDTASASKDGIKIGVLVADVSGEEALGFRNYYEEYIQNNYDVTFEYTDALESAEDEKAAIEKFTSKGYDAIISLSSSDRAQQIETCEEYGVYYAIASGVLDDEQYEQYKGYEYFVGQIGPSNETEFEAGKAMGEYYKEQGISTVAIYGAFIPNPMHVYRAAGIIAGLGDTYGGTDDMNGMIGQIFGDQAVDPSKIEGDVEVVAYLQGYGDTTTDELNAAIQKAPEAFLSVGMATTFFAQTLSQNDIQFADIDSFTEMNLDSMTNGTLTYLAGKYSSSIGPVFALVMNAVNGNVIRDNDGNAVSLSQGYLVATDVDSFNEYYVTDNGDTPIFDKESLDTIIGDAVTYDDVKALVESK